MLTADRITLAKNVLAAGLISLAFASAPGFGTSILSTCLIFNGALLGTPDASFGSNCGAQS